MTSSDKCNRCGKCCVVFDSGKWIDCKFLIRLSDGKTECSVYETRLGRDLGNGFTCTMVEFSGSNYPECPYNTEEKPLHAAYKQNG